MPAAACLALALIMLAASANANADATRPRTTRASRASFTIELPAWSPSGRQIAWATEEFPFGGSTTTTAIWIANTDGTHARPVVSSFENGPTELIWDTPDELLYDQNFGVWRARTDGTHAVVLPGVGSSFSTDARGTTVVSSCDQCVGPVSVGLVASATRRQLPVARHTGASQPAIAPDGTRVVYARILDDPAKNLERGDGLWLASIDGSHVTRLTTSGFCPRWSPNGKLIVYFHAHGIQSRLRLVAANGGNRRVIPSVDFGPSCSTPSTLAWAPNSKAIAYSASDRGPLDLVDVATGRTRTIGRLPSVTGVAWSPDGTRLLVTAAPNPSACASLWIIRADGTDARRVQTCG